MYQMLVPFKTTDRPYKSSIFLTMKIDIPHDSSIRAAMSDLNDLIILVKLVPNALRMRRIRN
jgi:hypothetical protein